MTKTNLQFLLLVILIVGAARLLLSPDRVAKASSQQTFGACIANVPQEWGTFRGGSEQTGIAFEDRQGTLRFVTNIPCNGVTPAVALEVRRTSSKN